MYNNLLRSILISSILMIVMLTPAYADDGISISVKPVVSKVLSSDVAYTGTLNVMNAPHGGFYFLRATIPGRYEFVMPPSGSLVGTYTMFDQKGLPQIIIKITSNNTMAETVDVTYSTDGGKAYNTKKGLPITDIVIGASSLKLTKPKPNKDGSLDLFLGGTAGPVNRKNKVIVEMARGALKNPNKEGDYTWSLVAKNNPRGKEYTASVVVKIIK